MYFKNTNEGVTKFTTLPSLPKTYTFIITLLSVLFLTSSCGSGKSFKIGDHATTNQKCLSAISLDDFDSMVKISVRKDEPALVRMVANESVFVIPENTSGTVREVKFGKYLFECNVNGATRRLWVSSDFLK